MVTKARPAKSTSSKRSRPAGESAPPPEPTPEAPAPPFVIPDPATQYARDVVAGKILVCRFVRLACQRHLNDLETGPARGLHWRPELACLFVDFCSLLRHSSGKWGGQPFELSPWQLFFGGLLWGWRRTDGTRRFRFAHLEMGRKNGKTTLAAAIALALLVLDDEPGAEVYTAATKLEQAKKPHEECKRMAIASPTIKRRIKIFNHAITRPATFGKFVPLGRDSNTLDGLNVHGAICEEIHAWTNRDLYDVLVGARGARAQPLVLIVTTAGYNTKYIWGELRKHAVNVLEGKVVDDELLAFVCTIDDGDDWKNPAVYVKANPNLGVTLQLEDLISERDKAIHNPGAQNAFRRKKLNEMMESEKVWIPDDIWCACKTEGLTEADFGGRQCVSGLDLSTSNDLTALVHMFPLRPDEIDNATEKEMHYGIVSHFWLPEEGIEQKCDHDDFDYIAAAKEGWLTLVPGRIVKYDWVENYIVEDSKRFAIRLIAMDMYLGKQVEERLKDHGFDVRPYGQRHLQMAPPTIEWERCAFTRRFLDTGNPLLRWCVANVAIAIDSCGNRKPSKKTSEGRIDGVQAGLFGLGALMSNEWQSIYNQGGSRARLEL